MSTGSVEVQVEKIEVLNDIPNDLPFLPSSKNLKVSRNKHVKNISNLHFSLSLSLSLHPHPPFPPFLPLPLPLSLRPPPSLPHSLPLPPPTNQASDELVLRERQLHLRRPEMQYNLRLRSQVAMAMREFFVYKHGKYQESTTPPPPSSDKVQYSILPNQHL